MCNLALQLTTLVLQWQLDQQDGNPSLEVHNLPQRLLTLALKL